MKSKEHLKMTLITILFMDLLVGMELDLFTPSFPEIQAMLNLSPFLVEALLSVNFIGYCVSLFFVGNLADRYGRKPIIFLGLLLFVIGSFFCLFGKLYPLFLIGRLLQGIGIAAPSILGFVIIADHYPINKQQFLMAMLNGSTNTAGAIAPVIGSYITLYFHWQANFKLLLLLGLIALVMALFFIPTYKTCTKKLKTDSLKKGYSFLFQSKPLLLLITHIVFMFTPYWIFVGISPLLYMNKLHVHLSYFGYYQGVFALVFAIGSVFFGLTLKYYRQKKMLFISNCIFIASLISVFIVTFYKNDDPMLITMAFLPFIIGQIIPSIILYPLCLNVIPNAKGRVSAILQGSRLILSAFFLQLAGFLYEGSFRNIGIILLFCIIVSIFTLFLILNNRELMNMTNEATV